MCRRGVGSQPTRKTPIIQEIEDDTKDQKKKGQQLLAITSSQSENDEGGATGLLMETVIAINQAEGSIDGISNTKDQTAMEHQDGKAPAGGMLLRIPFCRDRV